MSGSRTSPLTILSLIVALLLGMFGSLRGPEAASALQATPPASGDAIGLPEGVTLEILAYGVAPAEPSSPVDLTLYRLTLDPDARYTLAGDDPSLSLVYVETGALQVRLQAPVTVQRASDPDSVFTEQTDEVVAGEEFSLEAGDSVLLIPRIAGELRNDGTDPARIIVAQVFQPDVVPADTMPAATPSS